MEDIEDLRSGVDRGATAVITIYLRNMVDANSCSMRIERGDVDYLKIFLIIYANTTHIQN